MSSTILIIVLSVAIIGGKVAYDKYKENNGIASGAIIKRSGEFWHKKYAYTLDQADYQKIWDLADAIVHTPDAGLSHAEGSDSSGRISFSGAYSAALVRQEETNGKATWEFSFTNYELSNGVPNAKKQMNAALTKLEKGLLEIDPLTMVVERHHAMKTKTHFL